jgi:hypothetical protein
MVESKKHTHKKEWEREKDGRPWFDVSLREQAEKISEQWKEDEEEEV